MLVPHYADVIEVEQAFELTFVAGAAFIVLVFGIRPRPWKVRIIVPPHVVWFVITATTVCVYGYMFMTTGLTLRFVALGDVQDLRFAYRDELQVSGGMLAYLILLQSNVINPIIVARGIYAKRFGMVLVGALGQFLIFSVTGYKLVLLSIPAFVGLALAHRWQGRLRGAALLGGVMGAAGLALAIDWLQGSLYYAQIFINRLLLTPGTLSAAHILVFDDRPKAMWGHSFLAGIVDYPYSVSPAFLVGTIFSGSAETSANANFIADGYANLGYPGIFIETVILIVILRLLDATGRDLPIAVTSIILLVPTLATVNSGAFTSLLTGGYLAAMILMATVPRTGWGLSRSRFRRSEACEADEITRREANTT
ncbi:hypothetical protein ATJ97_1522 [Georgenia soli]|uniref:Oligosaccharide repeat unit polymerase n=2 Tax=Georgenia soli TaxID=638953 RepID=A0A2A9EIX5_9MICO|nr:hypothetical protein ATJ97_1522 [Georgenia soli]